MKSLIVMLSCLILFSCKNVGVKSDVTRRYLNNYTENNFKGKINILIDSTFKIGGPGKGWFESCIFRSYDKKGDKTFEKGVDPYLYHNEAGKFWTKKYKCDSNANIIEEIQQYEGSGLGNDSTLDSIRTSFSYNNKNNLIKINYSGAALTTSIEFKYLNNGQIIDSAITYDRIGTIIKDKYEVKDNSMHVKYYFYKSGNYKLYGEMLYRYDDFGDEISFYHWLSGSVDTNKTTYKYINYDQMGNWLKRIEINNNQPGYITERTIKYY